VKRVVKKHAVDYTTSAATNFLANSVKVTKTTLSDAAVESKRIASKYQDRIPSRLGQKSRDSLLILND
jgi:hypothetical protein